MLTIWNFSTTAEIPATGGRRVVGGERVEREGFAEPQRHQPIAVPGDQEPGHRRRQRRDHEHGVRHLRPVLLLFELLVAQGRDGAIPLPAVEARPEAGEPEHFQRQVVGAAADLAHVDGLAPQCRQMTGDLVVDLALDQEVEGLDVERDDLSGLGPPLEAEASLDEGEVERPGVQAVERVFRPRGLDQVDPDAPQRRPRRETSGDLMAHPQDAPGGHPVSKRRLVAPPSIDPTPTARAVTPRTAADQSRTIFRIRCFKRASSGCLLIDETDLQYKPSR